MPMAPNGYPVDPTYEHTGVRVVSVNGFTFAIDTSEFASKIDRLSAATAELRAAWADLPPLARAQGFRVVLGADGGVGLEPAVNAGPLTGGGY